MRLYLRCTLIALLLLAAGCAVAPKESSPVPLADHAHLRELVAGVQLNATLNPRLWQGDHLDPVVRERLLEMADQFIADLGFTEVKVKEIIFAGSNVGYLYHDQSDIDVHVKVDGSSLTSDQDLLFKLFNAVSDDWNRDFDFRVRGYNVELFMIDYRRKEGSAGLYSLDRDAWISRPKKPANNVDLENILEDVERFADEFERIRAEFTSAPGSFDCTRFERYRKKLKDYRAQEGFDRSGEYSVGNLGFKALRNGGYLDVAKAEQARCLELRYNLD